jgi:hypothetical protein
MLEMIPMADETRFLKHIENYLATTLHAEAILEPWNAQSLPLFLSRRYRFYEARIASWHCLLMAAPAISATPADLAKHVDQVADVYGGVVVVTTETMNASDRHRLISHGVAFIVPGNQLYIPQLAMDLRDHYRKPEPARGDSLTPAAQAVLFHHVLGRHDAAKPTDLADALRYSAMSIGRAFDELAARGLATVEWRGREKTIAYTASPWLLIDSAKTLLRRAARGVHGVVFHRKRPKMMLAGESALGRLTNLTLPTLQTYAIPAAGWQNAFTEAGIEDVNEIHEAEALIETWRYDPRALADGDTVDPLSLYAQFWDHSDERVAQAAEMLVEGLPR